MGKEAPKDKDDQGKVVVHILVCVFGITSWSILNGLWIELPILVSHLPEGWTLPSYLAIVTQSGILGPAIFSFLTWLFPRTKLETGTSMLVIIVLCLCSLGYAFLWRETTQVAGYDHSVALMTLTFAQAVFACTSSMCYLGFMAHLKARYMPSIFIGQGLSGLIPAFIGIAQGTGNSRCVSATNVTEETRLISLENLNKTLSASYADVHDGTSNIHYNYNLNNNSSIGNMSLIHVNADPDLSVRDFFLVLFAVGMSSLTSLLLLVFHPYCRTEHVNTDKEENCQLMQTNSPDRKPLTEVKDSPSDKNESRNASVVSTARSQKEEFQSSWMDDDGCVGEALMGSYANQEAMPEVADLQVKHSQSVNKGREEDGEFVVAGDDSKGQERQLSQLESWFLLGLLVWINALQTTFILAIQVYSSLPYGLVIYDGVNKTENIVDPIACFITLYVTARSTRVISALTLLGTLFIAYIITVAAMSPAPFLVHETIGGILVITAWAICTMLMVFSKVSIASVMRSQGRKSLMFSGASTQIGAFIGAVLAFCMVNQLKLFHDGPWC